MKTYNLIFGPGRKISFRGELDFSLKCKVLRCLMKELSESSFVSEQSEIPGTYFKWKVSLDKEKFEKEILAYSILQDVEFVPKMLSFGSKTYWLKEEGKNACEDFFFTWILFEKCGHSIGKVFLEGLEGDIISGLDSTTVLKNRTIFERWFPPERIPKRFLNQIERILVRLLEKGICHEDVHPGNFLIDREGKIWIIDFEFWSKVIPFQF